MIHVCTAHGRKEVVSLATASMFWLPLAKLEYIEISALGASLAKGKKIAGKSPPPSFAKPNHPFLSQRKIKAAITEGSTSPKDKPPFHTVFLHPLFYSFPNMHSSTDQTPKVYTHVLKMENGSKKNRPKKCPQLISSNPWQ